MNHALTVEQMIGKIEAGLIVEVSLPTFAEANRFKANLLSKLYKNRAQLRAAFAETYHKVAVKIKPTKPDDELAGFTLSFTLDKTPVPVYSCKVIQGAVVDIAAEEESSNG